VLAPAANSVALAPRHTATLAGLMLTDGSACTVMVRMVELIHPDALVPVTVYVVVIAGAAITEFPEVADSPDAGLQLYEAAPVALRVAEPPAQIAVVAGDTTTVGAGLTVRLSVTALSQPTAFVV